MGRRGGGGAVNPLRFLLGGGLVVLNDRDYLIMSEVSRWKYILGRQVRHLCGFDGERACDRRIKKLIDSGFLERKRYIYGVAGNISMTSKGKRKFDIELSIRSPRLDQIEHDITVVDTAIYFIKKMSIDQNMIKSDKQLTHKQGFGVRVHIPDFTFSHNDENCCVEVELSLKAKDRLEKNIKQNYLAYDVQYWIIPENKPKIKRQVLNNQIAYSNIEIIDLGKIKKAIGV